MRKIQMLFMLLALNACGSAMVSTRGFSNSPNAPTNEASMKGGKVKYLAQGADSVIRSRRENAYQKMHDTCHGPYKIVSESILNDSGAAVGLPGTPNMAVYGGDNWVHIDFACEN